MIVLGLALRLARAGGRLRTALVAAGCAVGTLVLLLTLAVPATQPSLGADDRRLAAVVLVALVVPVVALLASVSRLSATERDRRLATLRTLGVSAGATRAAAGLEAAAQAAIGVLGGSGLFLAVRPLVERWDRTHHQWFHGRELAPSPGGWALGTVGVVLVCLTVAVLPAREVTRDPLAVGRRATVARPRAWRVAPLLTGIVVLAWPVVGDVTSTRHDADGGTVWACLLGIALTGPGLPLAVPVLVRWAGDVLVRTGRPVLLVAGRRLQQEPASGTRLVATLLAAVFVVVGARCVVTAFEQTPQARAGHRVEVTGPQFLDVADRGGHGWTTASADAAAARLTTVAGVRRVAVHRRGDVACGWTAGTPAGAVGEQDPGVCESFEVARCHDLLVLGLGSDGCRDGALHWVSTASGPGAEDVPPAAALVVTRTSGATTTVVARVPVPAHLPVRRAPDLTNTQQIVLVVPPGWSGLHALDEGRGLAPHVAVTADGGAAVRDRIAAAVAPMHGGITTSEDASDWDAVKGYRGLLYAVGVPLFTLALLALLVTAADAAIARRRHLAALATVGAPSRVAAAAQAWQAAVPSVLGTALAGAAGLLAGTAYLTMDGVPSATPWHEALVITGGAAGAALVLAGAVAAAASHRRRE